MGPFLLFAETLLHGPELGPASLAGVFASIPDAQLRADSDDPLRPGCPEFSRALIVDWGSLRVVSASDCLGFGLSSWRDPLPSESAPEPLLSAFKAMLESRDLAALLPPAPSPSQNGPRRL